MRKLGCNTVGLETAGCYSIDVPENVRLEEIDTILDQIADRNVAVAFASLRHAE
jgi:hypothetical protein